PGLGLSLADKDDVLAVPLLELLHESVVHPAEFGEVDQRNKDDEHLLVGLLDGELTCSGESQRLQVLLELGISDLEVEEGLGNLLLELGGLLALLGLLEFPFGAEHICWLLSICF